MHAVSWLHQMAGLTFIAGSPIVQATLGGLRRELAKPKKRKKSVTPQMLLAMVEAVGLSPSLTEVHLLAICLVAFAGFLRCDELFISRNWRSKGLRGIRSLRNSVSIENVLTHS